MELIKCPECGEWYSPSYPRCPFCEEDGDSIRKKKRTRNHHVGGQRAGQSARGALIVVLVLVLALLSWHLFGRNIIRDRDAVKEDEEQTETTDKTEVKEPNVPAISTNVEPVADDAPPQNTDTPDPTTDDTPESVDNTPAVEPTDTKNDKTEPPAEENVDVSGAKLNRKDFTLSYAGEKFTIKLSGTEATPTWSIDNPNVATIRTDGTVVAVANGNTTAHCKVGSRDLTCVVRVRNTGKTAAAAGTPMTATTVTPEAPAQPTTPATPVTPVKPEVPTTTNTPAPSSGSNHVDASRLSVKTNYGTVLQKDPSSGYPDCTVRIGGDPLSLRIVGTDVAPSSWTSDNTDIVTVDANGKLTPVAKGTAHVTATVGDAKITCIIRVR